MVIDMIFELFWIASGFLLGCAFLWLFARVMSRGDIPDGVLAAIEDTKKLVRQTIDKLEEVQPLDTVAGTRHGNGTLPIPDSDIDTPAVQEQPTPPDDPPQKVRYYRGFTQEPQEPTQSEEPPTPASVPHVAPTTDNKALVYETVVQAGCPIEFKRIVQMCGLNRGTCWRKLQKLQRDGLVTKTVEGYVTSKNI
jgi:hypothetical protein